MRRVKPIIPSMSVCVLWIFACGPAYALDSDGDGIDDGLDNCVELANARQFDSDQDGFGNRCDVDFDQSGMANGRDVRHFMKALRERDPAADIDENGTVDFRDPIAASILWGKPPGPGATPADDDGDGVPALADLCAASFGPSGTLRPGCSTADVVMRATELIALPAATTMRRTFAAVESLPDYMQQIATEVNGLASDLVLAGRMVEGGAACEAANIANRTSGLMGEIRLTMENLIEYTRGELGRSFGRPDGVPGTDWEDANEFSLAFVPYLMLDRALDQSVAAVSTAAEDIQQLCDTPQQSTTFEAVVESFDPETRRLRLRSGHTVGVVAGLEVSSDPSGNEVHLGPGLAINAYGTEYGDGTIVVAAAEPLESRAVTAFEERHCLRPTIAPFQLESRFRDGAPLELHDAIAYLGPGSNELMLERGMLIGIDDSGCPPADNPFLHEAIYGAGIVLVRENERVPLANHLSPEYTVAIPQWLEDFETVAFEITTRRADCLRTNPDNCTATRDLGTETWTAMHAPRGYYCAITYEQRDFRLEFAPDNEFAVATPKTLVVPLGPGRDNPTSEFVGLGLKVANGTHGSSLEEIRVGENFAVYRTDFRDSWDDHPQWAGDTNTVLGLVDDPAGLDVRPGLVWPSVRGIWNGAPFRYSCRTPRVNRDVVNFCSGQGISNAFFTMPLEANQIGQGPNGQFSHMNAEAWDIRASVGTPVRASRGGRVVFSVSDQLDTCDPLIHEPDHPLCFGNGVILQHSDGTHSAYWHFDVESTFVGVGYKAGRGSMLGLSGNTGYSTGPHLHLESRLTISGVKREAWFKTARLTSEGIIEPLSCYEPRPNDFLLRQIP